MDGHVKPDTRSADRVFEQARQSIAQLKTKWHTKCYKFQKQKQNITNDEEIT